MQTVQATPAALGNRAAKCPKCGASTLITSAPPVEIKCPCGETYKATWWRYGDPVLRFDIS